MAEKDGRNEIKILGESCGVRVVLGIGDRVYIEREKPSADGKTKSWIPWMEMEPTGRYAMNISVFELRVERVAADA